MRIFRMFRIISIIIYYGVDQLIFKAAPSKIFFLSINQKNRAVKLRKALIQLGPLFIKFGQILSTRRDLLPNDIASELAHLQDKVPPYSFEIVKKQIEKNYNQPAENIFSEIDDIPLGSASIAQVHGAKLIDGTSVVIKLLRPNIKLHVERDIRLLYSLAKMLVFLQPFKKITSCSSSR